MQSVDNTPDGTLFDNEGQESSMGICGRRVADGEQVWGNGFCLLRGEQQRFCKATSRLDNQRRSAQSCFMPTLDFT